MRQHLRDAENHEDDGRDQAGQDIESKAIKQDHGNASMRFFRCVKVAYYTSQNKCNRKSRVRFSSVALTCQLLGPAADANCHSTHMISHGEAGDSLARLQVMVTVFKPENLDQVRELVGSNLFACAKHVARSLHDEGRRLHVGEMRSAQLIRFADWMKRIAKTQQSGDPARWVELVGGHAGDAPTQRFSADDKWARRVKFIDRGDILGYEVFRPRGRPFRLRGPARRHVTELEASHA